MQVGPYGKKNDEIHLASGTFRLQEEERKSGPGDRKQMRPREPVRRSKGEAEQRRKKSPARISSATAKKERDSAMRRANYDPGEYTNERKSADPEQCCKKNFGEPRVGNHRLCRSGVRGKTVRRNVTRREYDVAHTDVCGEIAVSLR